ncbi:MAG: PEP-CTERM sorting domain-containing protein [Rhodoferax sp.]|nr:PEP-CTERM sorting domain-containing protein [Rhodoferax sp.]
MTPYIAVVSLVWALAGAPAQAANLLVNGGFEAGDFSGWTTNFTPSSDTNAPQPALLWIYDLTRVYEGAAAVDFNYGNAPATAILSQTFATTVGATYDVSFWTGAIFAGEAMSGVKAELLGADGSTVLQWSTTTYGGSGGKSWGNGGFSFIGDGALATIRFTDISPDTFAADALLDSVSVTAAVPEPETVAMLLTGLGLVGLVARRKRVWRAALATGSVRP